MNWFSRIVLHRAAHGFARRLPRELHADWGASDAYTIDQVRAALARSGLGGRYVAVAYAMFLTEADYLTVAPSLPFVLPYDKARAIYARERPWGDAFSDLRDSETTATRMMTKAIGGD
jgi:hypothetical protein